MVRGGDGESGIGDMGEGDVLPGEAHARHGGQARALKGDARAPARGPGRGTEAGEGGSGHVGEGGGGGAPGGGHLDVHGSGRVGGSGGRDLGGGVRADGHLIPVEGEKGGAGEVRAGDGHRGAGAGGAGRRGDARDDRGGNRVVDRHPDVVDIRGLHILGITVARTDRDPEITIVHVRRRPRDAPVVGGGPIRRDCLRRRPGSGVGRVRSSYHAAALDQRDGRVLHEGAVGRVLPDGHRDAVDDRALGYRETKASRMKRLGGARGRDRRGDVGVVVGPDVLDTCPIGVTRSHAHSRAGRAGDRVAHIGPRGRSHQQHAADQQSDHDDRFDSDPAIVIDVTESHRHQSLQSRSAFLSRGPLRFALGHPPAVRLSRARSHSAKDDVVAGGSRILMVTLPLALL